MADLKEQTWKAIRDVVERCCRRVYDHPQHPDLETDLMVQLDLALLTHLSASYRAGAEDMREMAAELLERNDMNSAGFMAAEIRSLPLPDPQPTPTQESRDV